LSADFLNCLRTFYFLAEFSKNQRNFSKVSRTFVFSAEFSKSQLNFSKVSGIGFGRVDGNYGCAHHLRFRAVALRLGEKNGNLTNSHWTIVCVAPAAPAG
jgi:hypothetical protein